MKESQFWALIKEKLPGHVERIENAIGKGTPDVNMCFKGLDIWLELKILDEKGQFNKNDPRPEQIIWHIKRQEAEGRCFILGRNENMLVLAQVQKDRQVFEIWRCAKPFSWPALFSLLFTTPAFCKEAKFVTDGEKQ
jgi:hypothetical protein